MLFWTSNMQRRQIITFQIKSLRQIFEKTYQILIKSDFSFSKNAYVENPDQPKAGNRKMTFFQFKKNKINKRYDEINLFNYFFR